MRKKLDSHIKAPRALVFITNKLTPAPTSCPHGVWEKPAGNEALPPWGVRSLGKPLGLKRQPSQSDCSFYWNNFINKSSDKVSSWWILRAHYHPQKEISRDKNKSLGWKQHFHLRQNSLPVLQISPSVKQEGYFPPQLIRRANVKFWRAFWAVGKEGNTQTWSFLIVWRT